jgi:hypothetical protein
MKKRFRAIMLLIACSATVVLAQDSIAVHLPNALKLNIAAAAFRKVSLSYERQLNGHWSLEAGGGYKFGGKIPKFIGLGDFAVTSDTRGLRGYSISADARYHFSNCPCDGRTGLYAGAYINTSGLWGDLRFSYWNGTDYVDAGGTGDLREYGIGLQLGYQLVLRERFIIDLLFMGPRTSFQRLKMDLDSQFAADVIPQIEEEINQRLDWWGMDPISIPTDASAVVDFRFNNFRYSISVGYLF